MTAPTITTAVVPYHWREEPPRWQAIVLLDGRPTTLDCTHLHHTPEAAAKCERKVARTHAAIFAVPNATITEVSADLHEIQWTPATGFGSRGVCTKRFRYVDCEAQ